MSDRSDALWMVKMSADPAATSGAPMYMMWFEASAAVGLYD
jgi:hypothetical protein